MSGTEIIAVLSRKNSANFPIALGEDIIGAFVTVATTGARDAIPTNILRTGALCRIAGTNNFYEWSGAAWSLYSGFGSSGHTIKDEGVAVTPRTSLNFVGVNVSLSDDGSNTIVTIGAVSLTAGVSGVLPVANGGTGLGAGGTNGQILTMVSGAPAWATPGGGSLTAPANPADDGKLAIASAGNFSYALLTNANVDSAAAIALSKLANGTACSVAGRSANSSGAHADIASSADGEVFRRAGGALGWGTIATAGIADSAVTLAKLANATSLSVLGRSTNSSGPYADIAFANNDEVLMRSAGALATAKIANANIATGAAIDWSKLATAIGNLTFTGLKAMTYAGEFDNGTSGTSDAVDFTTGQLQKGTLTGNCAYTFTAPAGPCGVQLKLTQDGTGGRTVTLPTITWLDGVTWQPNPTASSTSILALYYDGTNYYGFGRALDSTVITESTTARTFGLTDSGGYVRTTNGSATTLSVPTNASVAFAIGTLITGIQAGAGQVTIVAVTPGTTTINKPASRNAKTAEQYSTWALKKVATDVWDLCGDLEIA